jgi:hypothetical protein
LTGCSPPEDERSRSKLFFQNRQPERFGSLPGGTRHAIKNEPASKSYVTRSSWISRKFKSLKIWICEMKGKKRKFRKKRRAKALGWIRYGQGKATGETILPRSPTQSESMYGEGSLIALGMIRPTPKLKIHQSEDQSIIPKFSQV